MSVPEIVITVDEPSQGRLTDLLLTGRGRVFSKKLIGVNIVGCIACVDHARSELVDSSASTTDLVGYDRIVLDETKIGGARMFLLAEMPVQIVVHSTVAAAVTEAGPHGDRIRGH